MQYAFLARASTRHLLLAACTTLLLGFISLYAGLLASGQAGPKKTDFVPAYTAAQLMAQGRGDALYDLHQLGQAEASVVRPLAVSDGVMPYLYPPHLAVLMSPLAHLPYGTAFLLWLVFSLGLLLLAGFLVQRYLGLGGSGTVLFGMAAASFLPVLVALAQGQVSILLLAAAAGALWAFSRGRELLGGALITVLAIKPTYLAPILLVLAVRAHWRALAGAAGALIAAAGLASIVLGPRILTSYVAMLLAASHWQNQIGGFSPRWNQGLASLTSVLHPSVLSIAVSLVLTAGLVLLLARCAHSSPRIDVPFAAALVVGLLASPHVLIHDLCLLIIPAAVLWRESHLGPGARAGIVISLYLTVLLGLPLASTILVSPVPVVMGALGLCLLSTRTRHLLRVLPAGASPALPSQSQTLSLKDCS